MPMLPLPPVITLLQIYCYQLLAGRRINSHFLRSTGDSYTRLDRHEPSLNEGEARR